MRSILVEIGDPDGRKLFHLLFAGPREQPLALILQHFLLEMMLENS